jgi:hypothetical protein
MRLMIVAERPEPLWLALRIVQVVLHSPSGASSEPKRLRLLVERQESGVDENVPELPDLRRLSRLHLCNDWRATRLGGTLDLLKAHS